MKAVIVGAGAVGTRLARQLVLSGGFDQLCCYDRKVSTAAQAVAAVGPPLVAAASLEDALVGADVVICAQGGRHQHVAREALQKRCHVVSTAWSATEVAELSSLGPVADLVERHLVVGAGFSPGLTCLLAKHLSGWLDDVEDVSVARVGRGGPACRKQSSAHAGRARGWWSSLSKSGGRLVFFPEPVGTREVQPSFGAEQTLLSSVFPSATTCFALGGGNRWTLRPKAEDSLGAVWVELRGTRGSGTDVIVGGCVERPALGTAAVAATAALWAVTEKLSGPAAGGLGVKVDQTAAFLRDLAERGVRAAVFEPATAPD